MRHLFFILAFIVFARCGQPVRQFCLEELKREYNNLTDIIQQKYAHTGENNCFDLKIHVARCMDRSMYALIRALDPQQLKDKTKIPSLSVANLESSLKHYVDVHNLPGFEDYLIRCAHFEQTKGLYTKVITVGDFSKRCACDLGSAERCRAYKHVGGIFACGNAEPLSMVL